MTLPLLACADLRMTDPSPHSSGTVLTHMPAYPVSLFFRLLDWFAKLIERKGPRLFPVDTTAHQKLLTQGTEGALAIEGSDWHQEEAKLEKLWRTQIHSIDHTLKSSPQPATSRLGLQAGVKLSLKRRCDVYRYLQAHSDIVTTAIPKPLIILGLPRTGSTLLQRLLAKDSRFRGLQFWELLDPVPPLRGRSALLDGRKFKTELGYKALNLMIPGHLERTDAFHPTAPDYVDEETNLLWSAGVMNAAWWHHMDPAVVEEILAPAGKRAAYRLLKRSLQLLVSQQPATEHLLLKSPFHGLYLDTLMETFPDAMLLSLHRDPIEVVQSWISFMGIVSAPSFGADSVPVKSFVDPHLRFLKENATRLADFLPRFEQANPGRHLPLAFESLIENPLKTLEPIYEFMQLGPPSTEDAAQMTQLLKDRATKPTSRGKFSVQQLGLTDAQLRDEFLSYETTFGKFLDTKEK